MPQTLLIPFTVTLASGSSVIFLSWLLWRRYYEPVYGYWAILFTGATLQMLADAGRNYQQIIAQRLGPNFPAFYWPAMILGRAALIYVLP